MNEPSLLNPNKVIKKNIGIINFLLHKAGVIKIPEEQINNILKEHSQKVWQQWVDWRWNNATMMVGSYDKMSQDHKFRCMEDCYMKACTLEIDYKYIQSVLGKNNFGWEVPLEDNSVCPSFLKNQNYIKSLNR